ncbi:MAG: sigma-70 family RNA polymerase sigma factor [Planctomycetota bacterium]
MAVKTKGTSEEHLVDDNKQHLKTVALRAYSSHQKQPIDDEQIADYLPMVRKIVQRIATYLKPPLSTEDLVSAGTIGLIKAARDFDPSRQAEFETYAYIRIKGAIIDELRGFSLLPPSLNKQVQTALQVGREITEKTGTAPADDELAEKLGITVDKLYRTLEKARAQHFISIHSFSDEYPALGDLLSAPAATSPDKQLEQAELVDKLTEAIQQLDKRRRQIILLYYQQHLTMKQVAEILKITESRVSQLHASALFRLSARLRQWKDARW